MWAPRSGYNRCKKCNRADIPHHAAGLCEHCYDKSRQSTKKFRRRKKSWRDRTGYMKCWREKNLQKCREKAKLYARKWRKTPAGRGKKYREYQRERIMRFLNGGRIMKDYIEIICSCGCGQRFHAPFRESDLPQKEPWLMLFRKKLSEKHLSNINLTQ